MQKILNYAKNHSVQYHMVLMIIGLVGYISIIIFGFAPTSELIQQSGYSTDDLQNAASISEVNIILDAWVNIMPIIIRLSVLDYLFILMGLVLFISIHSLVIRAIPCTKKFVFVPIIGIFVTFLSRTLDAFENLWTILIYSNPDNFSFNLISLLNFTTMFKWIIVGFEFIMLILSIIGYVVIRKSLRK